MTPTLHDAAWRKSSHSGGQGGNCVEVAPAGRIVGIRDSKRPGAGTVTIRPATWRTFVTAITRR